MKQILLLLLLLLLLLFMIISVIKIDILTTTQSNVQFCYSCNQIIK